MWVEVSQGEPPCSIPLINLQKDTTCSGFLIAWKQSCSPLKYKSWKADLFKNSFHPTADGYLYSETLHPLKWSLLCDFPILKIFVSVALNKYGCLWLWSSALTEGNVPSFSEHQSRFIPHSVTCTVCDLIKQNIRADAQHANHLTLWNLKSKIDLKKKIRSYNSDKR